MSRGVRLILLALAALVLVPAAVRLAATMPTFGAHALPYGDAVNALAPAERRVTNAVTAVNFDVRGFDTMGEEFMLLAAVTGTVALLRGARGEATADEPARVAGRPIPRRTDAAVLVSRALAPLVFLYGVYVALHATTTPGGGFQGGVVIASSLLLIFISVAYAGWRRIVRSPVLDACEGGGALLFVGLGFAPLLLGQPFAANILPLGTLKSAWSGGSMFAMNVGVTLAVFGGFGLVLVEFMEETRADRTGAPEQGDEAP